MRIKYVVAGIILFCAGLFTVLFLLYQENRPINKKIYVVCTTGMITDAVKTIGGDELIVHGLMGPGVDPHLYRATQGDAQRLAAADLIFCNGLHLEGKMVDVFKKMDHGTKLIAVGERLEAEKLLFFGKMYSHVDPHIWFDVSLWIDVVGVIKKALVSYDSDKDHQKRYTQRADAYVQELLILDTYVRQKAASIPPDKKILITAHDAFHYFGKAYGFKVVGLQGISTDCDISANDVQNLVDFIVTHKVRTIFVESCISPRSLCAVQDAVVARGFFVDIGQELFSDALGNAGTQTSTYVGMIKYTIDILVAGLGELER